MNERTLEARSGAEIERNKFDAPGRTSASAALRSSDAPLSSGILMRKASGGPVTDDASSSVDHALGTSSGHGLPDELRTKFEASLGTDLSSVRIHDGSESQAAASSVSAQAFTVGNDIHFGAGKYDPGSSSGQHLIAHEVAHTVQQRGGSPTRQNKLAVSSAADSFEIAADRAADSMVVGAPTSVDGATMSIARKEDAAPEGKEEEGGTIAAGTQSIKKGPVSIELAWSSDGKVALSGGVSASAHVLTGIPGVFVEGELSAKTTGEGMIAKNGSASLGGTGEVAAQVTLNGGIPNVASFYGGGALAAKLGGITAKRSVAGDWTVEVNSKIALVGKAVIGVKAEAPEAVKEALPPGWTPELKYEINPGGEVELLVFDMANNSFSQGKDVASIVAKANSVLAAAGLRSPEKLKALKAKSITKILKEAREEQEAAKQNAADRKDYDKAYNPKQQQSGGEVSPLDELDSCE